MLGVARRQAVPLNVVGYFKNAALINGVLEKLNPELGVRFISVEPGIDFVLKIKERIERGRWWPCSPTGPAWASGQRRSSF